MSGDEPKRTNYLQQAWLVLLLGFVYGGALAGVQTTLAPRIEANKLQETLNVIPNLVAGAVSEQSETLSIEASDGRIERVYRTRDAAGKHNGWVLAASGQGFADKIEVLIGLDDRLTTITGIYVLDQKETPGLGDYIREASFLDRFRNKPTARPLSVVKTSPQPPLEIQALSGATVSSWAVCDIVNQAIARLREPIQNEQGRSPAGSSEAATGDEVPR
jgi:Na+-translocating ferredoxin:NAD+ oxidoreductase subunit G